MKTTLTVMAAGMGSRYGGNKQTDGVGPHGETLMEYSVYDAIRAGFRKIVFIIKPDAENAMETLIGKKLAAFRLPNGERIEYAYAYQDFSSIPAFYTIPAGRTKPFGTGHALLCAADAIQEPFAVLNADDYYGPDAFRVMHQALTLMPPQGHAAMVGYVLKNTVSTGGTVSRGICEVQDGILQGVTERLKIGYRPDGSLWDAESGMPLDAESIVSMNLWGFAPSFFPRLKERFETFLREQAGDNPKAEYQLPTVVNTEMQNGKLTVSVLHSTAVWFGMTYHEERAQVAEKLQKLHENGIYPDNLWKSV